MINFHHSRAYTTASTYTTGTLATYLHPPKGAEDETLFLLYDKNNIYNGNIVTTTETLCNGTKFIQHQIVFCN
jgi:hypothetical protein